MADWSAPTSSKKSRHADQDHGELGGVVAVAKQFERGRGESFGFVDDEELNPAGGVAGMGAGVLADAALVFVDVDAQAGDSVVDVAEQLAVTRKYFGGVEDGAGTVGEGVVLGVA